MSLHPLMAAFRRIRIGTQNFPSRRVCLIVNSVTNPAFAFPWNSIFGIFIRKKFADTFRFRRKSNKNDILYMKTAYIYNLSA